MPMLWGTERSRDDLLRHMGDLEQAAGVRLVTLGDGLGRGVRALEFRTGSGFSFEVIVDRCFDIGRCEYAGRPRPGAPTVGSSGLGTTSPRDGAGSAGGAAGWS